MTHTSADCKLAAVEALNCTQVSFVHCSLVVAQSIKVVIVIIPVATTRVEHTKVTADTKTTLAEPVD